MSRFLLILAQARLCCCSRIVRFPHCGLRSPILQGIAPKASRSIQERVCRSLHQGAQRVRVQELPIVVVVEPDSLPNLATSLDHPHCGNPATVAAYMEGIGYALEQLTTQVPKVSVFLDAARGGWVGWEDNLDSSTLRCLGQRHHRQGLELLARMLQGRSGEDEEGGLKHAGRQHPEARPRLMQMRAHRARLAHPRLPYMNAFVIHPHVYRVILNMKWAC